MFLKTKRTKT